MLAEPPVLTEPPLGPPASLPLPLPPLLPAVPALELPAAAPQVRLTEQSSSPPQPTSASATDDAARTNQAMLFISPMSLNDYFTSKTAAASPLDPSGALVVNT